MRTTIAGIIIVLGWAAHLSAQLPVDGMVKLTLAGRQIEGTPLAWDETLVHFLGRDGRLWQFDPNAATDFHQTANRFQSYSTSEFRAALLQELGGEFEVTGTSHYLVAHARGQGDKWAERFEDLYRSLVHYFSVRGFQPSPPPFPLVGIVCRSEREFRRHAAEVGLGRAGGVQGFYALNSNRIILFDLGRGKAADGWERTATIIIHEATHQTAFNTGIHSRYSPPPRWVAEGLATMFEAPGVYDSRNHPGQSQRINQAWLSQFRQLAPRHRPELLASLVASDDLFRINPVAAYAEAWALTFYLMESEPRKYHRYLALTARRPPFSDYPAADRRAEFTAVFGSDWRMLEARILRFFAELGDGI